MKNRKELWGERIELAGLVMVVIVAIWQVAFTDWIDEQGREWQFLIQEQVNLAILSSQSELAYMLTTEDVKVRQQIGERINEVSGRAISKAIRREMGSGLAITHAIV